MSWRVCPDCHKCFEMVEKCPLCNEKLIHPAEVTRSIIHVKGRHPTQEELLSLQSCDYSNEGLSALELKAQKEKLTKQRRFAAVWLFAGLAAGFFFKSPWIAVFIGIVVSMIHFLWASVRFKSMINDGGKVRRLPFAFNLFWYSILNRNEGKPLEFTSSELSAESVLSCLPRTYRATIDRQELVSYVEALKVLISNTLVEKACEAREKYGIDANWKDARICIKTIKKTLTKVESQNNVVDMNVTIKITLEAKQQVGLFNENLISLSEIIMNISQTYIKNGNYWFAFDPTPSYKIRMNDPSDPSFRLSQGFNMKSMKKVIIAVSLITFFVGLLIMAISLNIEEDMKKASEQSAIALQKSPANVVMEEKSSTTVGEDGNEKLKKVIILFRETTGACSTHCRSSVNFVDNEGKAWFITINNETAYTAEFALEPSGTYSYERTLPNYFKEPLSAPVYFKYAIVSFAFEDEGGRRQRIEYTVNFS